MTFFDDISPTSKVPFHIGFKDSDGNILGLIVGDLASSDEGQLVDRDLKYLNVAPIDRTALKTSQGDPTYSDFRPPYYSFEQNDFSGGRGLVDLLEDKSRYYDAGGIDAKRSGYLFLGPQEQFSGLIRAGGQHQPTSLEAYDDSVDSGTEWAVKVVPDTTTTYDEIWIYSNRDSLPGVTLYDGADAAFETQLQTINSADIQAPSFAPGWHIVTLDTPQSVNNSDGVWVSVQTSLAQFKGEARCADISGFRNPSGTPTASDGFGCRLVKTDTTGFAKLFEYKQALYMVREVDGAIELWMNGYRGVCSAGSTTTATTDLTLTLNQLAGAKFKVISGTGRNEVRRWREIASNTAGASSVLTFTDGYSFALASGTEFVILGTDIWTEIAGHNLVKITDVFISSEGVVYFCQGVGESNTIRRMREYNNAGTWTTQWADETAAANFLVEINQKVYSGSNVDGQVGVWEADVQDWGTNLSFTFTNSTGDATSPITGLEVYQDSAGASAPFVLKEEIIGPINQTVEKFQPVDLREMASKRGENNGRAHLVHNTNLYFSFGNGWERYYYPNVDDLGPNRDDGLPSGRQGPIVAAAGLPGYYVVGIDGGSTGYSSVMSGTGGWHEEWRGPYGHRMHALYAQPIPGDSIDRLWMVYGSDITWLPIASDGNPLNDSNFLYTPAGYLDSSEITTSLKAIRKYLSALKLVMREATGTFEMQYKINGGSWTSLYAFSESGPVGEPTYSDNVLEYTLVRSDSETPYYGLEFFTLQYRVKLSTNDQTETPVAKSVVLDLIGRVDNKNYYTIPFVLEGGDNDKAYNLLGGTDIDKDGNAYTPGDKLDQIKTWATRGPVYMRSKDVRFHDKMAIVLPFVENLIEFDETGGKKVYLGQLTVQDA